MALGILDVVDLPVVVDQLEGKDKRLFGVVICKRDRDGRVLILYITLADRILDIDIPALYGGSKSIRRLALGRLCVLTYQIGSAWQSICRRAAIFAERTGAFSRRVFLKVATTVSGAAICNSPDAAAGVPTASGEAEAAC